MQLKRLVLPNFIGVINSSCQFTGKTLLHFACAANDIDLVMYLLTNNPDCDINAIDEVL